MTRRLSENREPTAAKPFWPDFPLIFVKERSYSPQMIKKSDSKELFLATVPILGQPPRMRMEQGISVRRIPDVCRLREPMISPCFLENALNFSAKLPILSQSISPPASVVLTSFAAFFNHNESTQ